MSRTSYSLREILHPRSVAIIGASRAAHKWGHVASKQLIAGGFPGAIYLVTPSAPELLGQQTYASLRDVPDHVDLAVISTAFDHVAQAAVDCIAFGVKGRVINAAGFSETREEGRAL